MGSGTMVVVSVQGACHFWMLHLLRVSAVVLCFRLM
jgi:hypothetical protein